MQKTVFASAIKTRVTSPQQLSFTMFEDNDIIGHASFSYRSVDKQYSKDIILDTAQYDEVEEKKKEG